MSRARLFLWIALAVVAGAYLPLAAGILGMHLAGMAWSALQLSAPWLAQTGCLVGGALAGAVLGAAQAALLRARSAYVGWSIAAGAALGLVRALYLPAVLLAAPIAVGVAASLQLRTLLLPDARFVRGQAVAAALVASALLVPFPRAASAALLLLGAIFSAWGARSQLLPPGAAAVPRG